MYYYHKIVLIVMKPVLPVVVGGLREQRCWPLWTPLPQQTPNSTGWLTACVLSQRRPYHLTECHYPNNNNNRNGRGTLSPSPSKAEVNTLIACSHLIVHWLINPLSHNLLYSKQITKHRTKNKKSFTENLTDIWMYRFWMYTTIHNV